MGLDMYLEGKKRIFGYLDTTVDEGFKVKGTTVELGYWRKHPNLHGYIVETFAEGKDDCQEIELDVDDIKKIATAVVDKKLPVTEGFFFGKSDGTEDVETLEILYKALQWLETQQPNSYRTVVYRASW